MHHEPKIAELSPEAEKFFTENSCVKVRDLEKSQPKKAIELVAVLRADGGVDLYHPSGTQVKKMLPTDPPTRATMANAHHLTAMAFMKLTNSCYFYVGGNCYHC
jgi:hypothetical protein